MSDWKDNLTKLVPYEAGKQLNDKDVLKLNSNENPYPPSPEVARVLKDFNYEELKKYPTLGISPLDDAIADYHGVSAENLICGNSSDEMLSLCFRAFFNSDKPVLFPDITYSFYPVWCSFYGIPFVEIPLSDSFGIDGKEYVDRENGGIVIPNPNAPTAIALGKEEIENLVKASSSSVVIIDEAYADFGEWSAIDLIGKYDNLLITKTMSKSRSLAGLRVGYAVGSVELIESLKTAMHSFNAYPLSSLSIKIAEAAIKDEAYFHSTTEKIKQTRGRTANKLTDMGFIVTESQTNFLFITHSKIDARDMYEYMLNQKILIRHFSKKRINNHLRVTIGTDDEMKRFLDAVGEYMEVRNVI